MVSWSSKSLSYAGRLQLIKAVITSTTNFWSSVFRLPQCCFDTINSLCSAFLWSGSPHITSKAKVRWEDVCLPKTEGGLGLCKLEDMSTVFALRLIWNLFDKPDTLWASWTRRYLLKFSSFWDTKVSQSGSWIWRKLLKLRTLAKEFMKVEVRDGLSTYFWFDRWLPIGDLFDVLGEKGIRNFGIDRKARVADGVDGNSWQIRRRRGHTYQLALNAIAAHNPPRLDAGTDRYLWKKAHGEFGDCFSSKKTWEIIRMRSQLVDWHMLVWFRLATPSRSFITWLAIKDKLSTGERMRQWGFTQACLLCGDPNETRSHLFFECPYSANLWIQLCGHLWGRNLSSDWSSSVRWVQSLQRNGIDFMISRLIFQALIYGIWKERNNRRHQQTSLSTSRLGGILEREIAMKLYSFETTKIDLKTRLLARWTSTRLHSRS